MQKVYFISGLGADERAFSFLDLSFCEPVFVQWIRPLERETVPAYAVRLKEQIPETSPIIVGLSFGGMVAVEIAKVFPCNKIVLLSSAKTQKEIPFYLKSMRWLPLHKLATPGFLKAANSFAYKLMGISRRPDKILFMKMLMQADEVFIKWSVDRIINWRNNTIPERTVHIHGTKDLLLPYAFVKADYTVRGGVHLMVMNRPAEISALLKECILN
jgi:pimeloyl-ACP methyl ester carboxylesterase